MMKAKAILLFTAASMVTAVPSALAQQPSIQQQFDAGTAALIAERWDEAERIFAGLEARLAATGGRSLAITRVRRASALLELGRRDEAAAALSQSLPALPASDASLNEDRFTGLVTLGRLSEFALDYAAANRHYRAADAVAVEPTLKMNVYRGLIQTGMFFDAPAALAEADEALALAATAMPGVRQTEASLHTLRARVLLNMGRFNEAQIELRRATNLLGGVTLSADLRDLVARSDLAIASLLEGDRDEARRLLSFTGAATMSAAFLPFAERMAPPRCGNGLSPDDVAVVEFSLRPDGTVGHVTPIYSSRQGASAVAFARAVREWKWNAQQISAMQPLFRAAIRIEMRCTQRRMEEPVHPPEQEAAIDVWLRSLGIPAGSPMATTQTRQELTAELAAAETRSGATSPLLIHPLMRLANADIPARTSVEHLRRAFRIAATAQAPEAFLANLGMAVARRQHEAAGRDYSDAVDYASVLAEPGLAQRPYANARLHLQQAIAQYAVSNFDRAAAALAQTRALPGFGPGHPLMAELLDLEVAIEAARGNRDAALRAYRAIGAENYACIAEPRVRSGSGDARDFPDDALRWGFEGWAQAEAQVSADGRSLPPRTTVAYPPFVFGNASEEIVGRFRYHPVFQPESGPCATIRRRIGYRLPGGAMDGVGRGR